MAERTLHGSCHCGNVRYTVDLDLEKGSLRCNCSLCSKSRAWFAFAPAEKFRLDSGEGKTVDYRWTPEGKPKPNLTYHICANCGVRTHAEGMGPGGMATVAVQVATLDDIDRDQLAGGIRYVDGRHDYFDRKPEGNLEAL